MNQPSKPRLQLIQGGRTQLEHALPDAFNRLDFVRYAELQTQLADLQRKKPKRLCLVRSL